MSLSEFARDGAAAIAGVLLGLAYFAALRRTVAHFAETGGWRIALHSLACAHCRGGFRVRLDRAAWGGASDLRRCRIPCWRAALRLHGCGNAEMEFAARRVELSFTSAQFRSRNPVVTTWVIILLLPLACWLITRQLVYASGSAARRSRGCLSRGIDEQIREVMHNRPEPFLPLIGSSSSFLSLQISPASSPAFRRRPRRLETPAALAFIVFLSVHYFGVRSQGFSVISPASPSPSSSCCRSTFSRK